MASIATCPGCTAQLAIPEATAADSRVLCPECAVEFSLADTIQLTLPKAMILPPNESTPVVAAASSEEVARPADAPAKDAPLASWEARLKKAIAAGDDPEPQPPVYETCASMADVDSESDNQVDVKSDGEPNNVGYETFEPTHEATPAFDFGSQLELPGQEESTEVLEVTKNLGVPKILHDYEEKERSVLSVASTFETAGDRLATDDPKTALAATEVPITKVNVPQFEVGDTTSPRPRRRWRRIAGMVLAGPVVGTVLGFYGLLCLKGPQADYLQMSRFLPAAMLPASQAEQPPAEDILESLPEKTLLATAREDPPSPPPRARLDEQVQPAAVRQQLPTAGISAQEFSELVAGAGQALPSFKQDGAVGADAFKLKAQAYMAVCRLAEQFEFIHQLGLSPQAQQQIERGKEMFRQATADLSGLEDLTYIASRWWDYDQRSNQGIFFVGQIGNIQAAGSRTLCHIVLTGNSGAEIPVLFDQLPFSEGQQIAVVGSVDHEPMQNGLDGPRVVISQYSYPLTELGSP